MKRAFALADLTTPCLLLDRSKVQRNCGRMSMRLKGLGVGLRPHMKTAKCAEVAALATDGHSGAITVSTLVEALWFAQRNFDDILYAVGMSADKLPLAVQVLEAGAELLITVDNPWSASAVAKAAAAAGVELPVLIEIDCGQHRAGVAADGDTLLQVADALHRTGTRVAGVMTHAGHSYCCNSPAEIETVAEQERAAACLAAERLGQSGHSCSTISAGSTPTATYGRHYRGLTELRPGVYQFGDLYQAGLKSCSLDDIAATVLATVTGHHRRAGHAIVDAGALALSKDIGAQRFEQDFGYGLVCDIDGTPLHPRVSVAHVEQEHGLLRGTNATELFRQAPIGSKVRILPNHVCMTAAAYPGYHLVAESQLVDFWPRCGGW